MLQGAFKDSQTGKVSSHGRFISGFGAGVLEALVIVTPFEVTALILIGKFCWICIAGGGLGKHLLVIDLFVVRS